MQRRDRRRRLRPSSHRNPRDAQGALQERYKPQRLFCVFQPHQHSRTRFLLEDFATSFAAADETIVPDIYFVRDSEGRKIAINRRPGRADHRKRPVRAAPAGLRGIVEYLKQERAAGDLVVTMGAGNVWEIGRELVG